MSALVITRDEAEKTRLYLKKFFGWRVLGVLAALIEKYHDNPLKVCPPQLVTQEYISAASWANGLNHGIDILTEWLTACPILRNHPKFEHCFLIKECGTIRRPCQLSTYPIEEAIKLLMDMREQNRCPLPEPLLRENPQVLQTVLLKGDLCEDSTTPRNSQPLTIRFVDGDKYGAGHLIFFAHVENVLGPVIRRCPNGRILLISPPASERQAVFVRPPRVKNAAHI